MTDRRTTGGDREWLPVANTLDTAGLWSVQEYIQRRQATIVAQVDFCTIYERCTGADRIMGHIRFMMW